MADLPLIPGTLAQDCYPASAQALYEEMFSKGHAVGEDVVGLLIQEGTPDPADQDKGWIPTNASLVPIYPGYVFVWHAVLGHWVSRHSIAASDPSRRIYMGTSASVGAYDGGDANPPGAASGPMWEIDTQFDGRVPTGVGVIPTSAPAATIAEPAAQVGATQDDLGQAGEYKHSLIPDEMQHMHGVGQDPVLEGAAANDDPALQLHRAWNSAPEAYVRSFNDLGPIASTGYTDGANISAGIFGTTKALADSDFPVVDGHNNIQPFVGVYFIKRTARQFIVAA